MEKDFLDEFVKKALEKMKRKRMVKREKNTFRKSVEKEVWKKKNKPQHITCNFSGKLEP
ncbi:hypothetical protein [Cloacibacterium sp.]|uniref:hypothetical protein n=1 Tax=Cloacibacterium sp. TaxID=1913682 RepID=UPI0035B04E8F